ncbi:uncharacterized protein PFL1_06307 [Pseudozyma flocculosa PF-1]|uniref:BTB domain-containing protein n=1 Tax=Pseudozyma flocculosa PF-1 TaxID=1277687 RepID=A0A061H1U6_9BASI|nr:uncharacterized protein PFL1_06307 [Pseudozyma flocculosa PF-1]EPQ26099.1 hypothetical protein PFL1_06307 [Pseudozyma flocculosa PF-1]
MSASSSSEGQSNKGRNCRADRSESLPNSIVAATVIRSEGTPCGPPAALPPFVDYGTHWVLSDTLNFGVMADKSCTSAAEENVGEQTDGSVDEDANDDASETSESQLSAKEEASTSPAQLRNFAHAETHGDLHHLLGHPLKMFGTGRHCRLSMSLRSGDIWLTYKGGFGRSAPKELGEPAKHASLALSFLSDGCFHTYSCCAAGEDVLRRNDHEKRHKLPGSLLWELESIPSALQRLLHEASQRNVVVQLAVTGHRVAPSSTRLLALHPPPPSTDRLLLAAAKLVAVDETNLVILKAMQDNPKDKRIIASKALLKQHCEYFEAMFESQFSEGRQLAAADADVNRQQSQASAQGEEPAPAGRDSEQPVADATQEEASTSPTVEGGESQRSESATDEPKKQCADPVRSDSCKLAADAIPSKRARPVSEVQCSTKRRRSSHGDENSDGAAPFASAGLTASHLSLPVIELHDVDPLSLQALVFYLYTGTCMFWSDKRGQTIISETEAYPGGPDFTRSPWSSGMQPCSAEKMYQYGNESLQSRAREHLISELDVQTAWKNLFSSKLAQLYDEVQEDYIDFCVEHFDEISELESFEHTVSELISGTYPPSAAKILRTVMARISKRDR